MEKLQIRQRWRRHPWQKMWKTMRIFAVCMCLFSFGLSAETLAQTEKVQLNVKNVTLETIFNEIQRQTDLAFLFNHELVADLGTLSLKVKDRSVEEVLNDIFQGTNLTWSLNGNMIVVKERQLQQQSQPEEIRVSGTVKDEAGNPLPGVAVVVKGTTIGTATNVEGEYFLTLPEGSYTLVFSMMGMKTQEHIVKDEKPLRIVMEEDVKQIDEVVVTGYQTISKERATGAYAIIDTKVLEQKPTANLSTALNGLVPGLVATSNSVGEDMRFVIRGKGTLQEDEADSDPLIVVDGFAISGYAEGADPFSTINPNDVESVTVLKDAAATSIYGARAANGVIVITTKKGKGGKLDISADAFWAVSSRADLDYYFNMASAENQFRYIELVNHYNPISFMSDPYADPQYHKTYYPEPVRLLFELSKGNIDEAGYEAEKARLIEEANKGLWKDDLNEYLFRNQFHHQYNVALRGASEKMNYAFSASYDEEKGYLQGDNNRRVLLNMATSAKLTKNLTFDVSLNSMFTRNENNGADLYTIGSSLSPWTRFVDEEGNFIHVASKSVGTVYEPILESVYEGKTAADWHYNPIQDLEYMDNLDKTVYYRVQGGLNYATTWGLNVSAKGQYEWRRYTTHEEYDPESYYVRDLYNTFSTLNAATGLYDTYFPQGGIFTDGGHVYEAYNLRGQADYTWTRDAHNLTVLAGTEILSSTTETTPSITRYGFNPNTNAVDATIDYQTTSFTNIFGQSVTNPFRTLGSLSSYEDRFFSVYANAAYTYDDRYSVTASFRTDASNYQSESQRDKFSPFWSVGASWLLSNERFLEHADWLNQLKLRASFGIAGVAAGKRATSSVTTVSTNAGTVLFPEGSNSIMARGNETLTWEKSRTFNVGVDLAMFGNKLSGSVEFYNKFSYDVLSNATVSSAIFGTDATTFNNAEVLNRGVEFSLSSDLPVAGDLRWQGVLNYAYNYNEVTKFSVQADLTPSSPGYMEGYPTDAIIALKPVGYTPEGYVQLQGKDGTLEIVETATASHANDLVSRDLDENNWFYYLGQRTPKSNLSFSNYFTWRGLTLSFMITGRFGYYVNRGDQFSTNTNEAHFSKQLDKSFAVYDEGYVNQDGYSAYPLYNDENNVVLYNIMGDMYFSASLFSTNYIKGDHIRLNEVYLGYDLPQGLLEKQGVFSRINVYAQASNLGLIWSKNGEMDPDYSVGNIKPMPTFTFGLKLGFKNW